MAHLGIWSGHAPNYVRVSVKSDEDLHNQVRRVRILGDGADGCAFGEIVES